MDSDVYLCFMYNPPANSAYLKSLNIDYLDDEDKYVPLAVAYEIDSNILTHNNLDGIVCSRGAT